MLNKWTADEIDHCASVFATAWNRKRRSIRAHQGHLLRLDWILVRKGYGGYAWLLRDAWGWLTCREVRP
jgi:hypothetical protein